MVTEFAAAIREGRAPLTDGDGGLRVLDVLEAASASLDQNGRMVPLSGMTDSTHQPMEAFV
jgi:predicted dehydrogenase